ncbi:MAG: response regulator transcription factor [Bacteroidetes bacterium]|nr:response regulator transcription factor [Bacteroidota bacterium]
MRIFVVENHEIFKEGLIKILNSQTNFEVVGSASLPEEIYSNFVRLNVDVLVLSITFYGKNEIELIQDLINKFPNIKILILCEHASERLALRLIQSGASGFVSKKITANELITALMKIMSGLKYIESELSASISLHSMYKSYSLPHEKLSDREIEVMRLIANGKKISKIASDLSLSINTISTYKTRIFEKMNMKSTAEIIRYVFEHNLL